MTPLIITLSLTSLSLTQREIENSFASNAGLVHHQVIRTEEGRKRYADLVRHSLSTAKYGVSSFSYRKLLRSTSSPRNRREHSSTKSHDNHMTRVLSSSFFHTFDVTLLFEMLPVDVKTSSGHVTVIVSPLPGQLSGGRQRREGNWAGLPPLDCLCLPPL